MPFRRFLLVLAGGILLAPPSICFAQQAPFGDAPFASEPDDLFGSGAEAPEPDADQPLIEPEAPAVQQLLETARRGPKALATAVAALARMNQWEEVDRLLSEAAAAERPESELAAMGDEIEPAMLLRLATHESLSEEARGFVQRLGEAASAEIESAPRLKAAIDRLGSESIDQRLASQRTLLRGGNASVQALVGALTAETLPAPRDRLLRTLLRLGDGGPEALRQLALYGTPLAQQRAIESLAHIDPQQILPELVTALHASDAGEPQRAVATSALGRLASRLPEREESIRFLHQELRQRRQNARESENDARTTTLWSIDEQRSGVQPRKTRLMLAAWRRAVDAAARLRRIGNLPPEITREALLTDLGYRVVLDPDWGDADQIEQLRQAYGPATTGAELSAAIGQALREGDRSAMVGLARLVEASTPSEEQAILLRGSSPQPTPLVQAASAPDPRVRYEAASAIARLAPETPFPGSSRVAQTFAEMRALSGQPTAILVESRLNVIQRLETLLSQLGYRVEVVPSVQALVRTVAAGGDLRLVLATTSLVDMPPIELVDRARRLDTGAELPIVFYGDSQRWLGAERWEAVTMQIATPASTAGLAEVMDAIQRDRQLPPLSALDRRLYRDMVPDVPSFRDTSDG